MRILVAGSSGFIGGRLCNYLADEGFEVVALYNKNAPTDEKWKAKMLDIVQIDLSSLEQVSSLSHFKPEVILNLISLDHIDSNGDPEIVTKNNILPTWNLLKHFSKQGIKKFIYLSTIHVYGNELNGVITENSPVLPASPYGLTHLFSEEVINMFAREGDFECYNIRFSNGFGAPQFMKNNCWSIVINNLCLSVWKSQSIILKSDGTPIRDFMNIIDLLIGIKLILSLSKNESDSIHCKTLNFSSNNTISMIEAAFIVKNVYEKKYNKEANIFINENQPILSFKSSKSKKYLIDNSLFLDLMGGNALHDMEFGINEIFNFLDNSEKR